MTNYFIIHGLAGKPFENWFPWLERKISEMNRQCIVPQFPTPLKQSYTNWERLLDYYKSLGFIDENTVFIAHSLGPVFIVKYVTKNKIKIKGLISVSGFNNFISGMEEFDRINKSFFLEDSKLSEFKNYVELIYCFMSDNDPHIPFNKLKEFANIIGGELYIIHNGGHFNTAAGYERFEEIYTIIKSIENDK